ncbi:ATP-dependent zinc metalloprotease FtsH [Gossypium australe]|uniref:ATP-dependent zinc metalloprotease FtsH n=1 Tax=Gossypium australe TaxID=47621 RepID=A0A5B6WS22_9ROSI|nr:ATP-dependent zinc metalloprotease FtsH [Gossypium australe]
MSTRRGARCHGRGRVNVRAGSSASGYMPNVGVGEAPASPVAETRLYERAVATKDAVLQVMLRILERVAGPNNGTGSRGSIAERLRANGVEIFKGIAGVAPDVAEYWLEATERIMDDLDCTTEQKLKGLISLLRKKLISGGKATNRSRSPRSSSSRLSRESILEQDMWTPEGRRDKSVAEYEAEFLRLSRYVKGIVATKYERCVRFEDGLRDNLRVAGFFGFGGESKDSGGIKTHGASQLRKGEGQE